MDPVAVIRDWLVGGSALAALVSTRIYGSPGLPDSARGAAAVSFDVAPTGEASPEAPVCSFRAIARCWGTTPANAWAVYSALFDRLDGAHMQPVSSGYLISAQETLSGQQLVDPDTEQPYVIATFETTIRR